MRAFIAIALVTFAVAVSAHRPIEDVDPAADTMLWQAVNSQQMHVPLNLPALSSEDVSCKVRCNDEVHDIASYTAVGDGKSCVGTFTVYCKGGNNHTCGVYGAKCEGKTTGVKTKEAIVATCEGEFRNFAKATIRPKDEDKVVKAFAAFGCLGTTIAIKANRSDDDATLPTLPGALSEGLVADEEGPAMLAASNALWSALGNNTIAEARCEGISGRFRALKVKDGHGKPSKCGKHDDEDDDEDSEDFDQGKFDKAAGKVAKALTKAGMTLLPASVPMGSEASEVPIAPPGMGPRVEVTCNGRRAWGRGFFPCLGKLEVSGGDRDAEMTASCKGFYTGYIGKLCIGFSSVHLDGPKGEVYDFCRGRKTARAMVKPGEGFAIGAWCMGKDLYITKKHSRSS
jgi:hypothetical protein